MHFRGIFQGSRRERASSTRAPYAFWNAPAAPNKVRSEHFGQVRRGRKNQQVAFHFLPDDQTMHFSHAELGHLRQNVNSQLQRFLVTWRAQVLTVAEAYSGRSSYLLLLLPALESRGTARSVSGEVCFARIPPQPASDVPVFEPFPGPRF